MIYNITNHPVLDLEREVELLNTHILYKKEMIVTEFEVRLKVPMNGVVPYLKQLVVVNETKVDAQGQAVTSTGYDEETRQPIYPVPVTGEYDFFLALFNSEIRMSDIIANAVLIADSRGRFN
jgi:hypothetical protein